MILQPSAESSAGIKASEGIGPEQISGWLKREQKLLVSHERIYQHIYADKRAGGDLWQHLRCRKKRRKRCGSYDRRGRLRDRVSIDRRPKIVDSRRRIGDREVDTIIGKNHQQAIVSLTERKSRFTLIKKVEVFPSDTLPLSSHLLVQANPLIINELLGWCRSCSVSGFLVGGGSL